MVRHHRAYNINGRAFQRLVYRCQFGIEILGIICYVFSENEVEWTMPWCPKCRSEYREGYFVCNSCSEQLVDELPLDEIVEYNQPRFKYDPPEFLISLKNGREADVVESLLTAHQIPVIKKYRYAGAYLEIYMGATVYGVDIYVPAQLLQEAKAILDSEIILIEENDDDDADDADVSVKASRAKCFKAWFILLFFYPGFIWIFLLLLLLLLKFCE